MKMKNKELLDAYTKLNHFLYFECKRDGVYTFRTPDGTIIEGEDFEEVWWNLQDYFIDMYIGEGE